jgi:hypothetical protein
VTSASVSVNNRQRRPVFHYSLLPRLPIGSKLKILGRKGGGHEFEDRQRHAARIYFFEDLAYCGPSGATQVSPKAAMAWCARK